MKNLFKKFTTNVIALSLAFGFIGIIYAATVITDQNIWNYTAVSGDTIDHTAWNELMSKMTPCAEGDSACRVGLDKKAGTPQVGITNALATNVAGTTGTGEILVQAVQGFFDGVNDFLKITDLDLVAANIRKGVSVFGITGTVEAGTNLDNIYVLNPARCGDGVLQADKEWSDAGSDVCERIPDIQLISKACTDLGAACTDVTTPATYIVKVALMNPTVVSTTSTVLSFVDAVGEGVTELVNTCNNITLNEAFSECSVEYTTVSGNRDASFHFAYAAPDGKEALITGSTNISANPAPAVAGTATHNTFTFDFVVDSDVVFTDLVATKEASTNMTVATGSFVASADNASWNSTANINGGLTISNSTTTGFTAVEDITGKTTMYVTDSNSPTYIEIEGTSTFTSLNSYDVLTTGDKVDLYNTTDENVDATLGTVTTSNHLSVIGNAGTRYTVDGDNLGTTKNTDGYDQAAIYGDVSITSGNMYWEVTHDSGTIGTHIGICKSNTYQITGLTENTECYSISQGGLKFNGPGTEAAYGSTYTIGDIIGIRYSYIIGELEFYKNGVSQGIAFTLTPGTLVYPAYLHYYAGSHASINFSTPIYQPGGTTLISNTLYSAPITGLTVAPTSASFAKLPSDDYLAVTGTTAGTIGSQVFTYTTPTASAATAASAETKWVSSQLVISDKPKEITVDASTTITSLETYAPITTGDELIVYNATDGAVERTAGTVTTSGGSVVSSTNPFADGSLLHKYAMESNVLDALGTSNGTATAITYGTGKFANAAIFDGSTSKITTNAPVLTTYSLSIFIKTIDTGDAGIVSLSIGSGTLGSALTINTASNSVGLTEDGFGWRLNSTVNVIDGNWHHIYYERVGNNHGLSIDNETLITASVAHANASIELGHFQNSALWTFNGSMDQFELYNRVLTPVERTLLYSQSSLKYSAPITATSIPTTKAFFNNSINYSLAVEDTAVRAVVVPNVPIAVDETSTAISLVTDMPLLTGERLVVDTKDALIGTVTNNGGNLNGATNVSTANAVPVKTDNTNLLYSFDEGTTFRPFEAFNIGNPNNGSTGWGYNGDPAVNPQYLGADLLTGTVVNKVQISSLDVRAPNTFIIQGSKNNSDWTNLSSQSGITWANNEQKTFTFNNSVAYRYYRIYITARNGTDWVLVYNLSFIEELNPVLYTADITAHALLVAPTKAYRKGSEPLTFISSTTSEYVGTNPISGLLKTGDTIQLNGAAEVVATNVIEGTHSFVDANNEFETVLYTGNGATQTVNLTNINNGVDFVWIKGRTTDNGVTLNHRLFDTIRGTSNELYSNLAVAEANSPNGLTAFGASNFGVGTVDQVNGLNETFVAWVASLPNKNPTNTAGTITSNTMSNSFMSAVSYIGNSTLGATIGHSLAIKPDLILLKNRSGADDWRVYDSINGATKYMTLSGTGASTLAPSVWNNVEPTTTVFTVGSGGDTNGTTQNYIAYAFASVPGKAKVGSYTGTGAAGNVVTTGFEPAWVMVKRTDSISNWAIIDNQRGNNNSIYPDLANAEDNGTFTLITLSATGFTLNDILYYNTSGGTFIYLAIAKNTTQSIPQYTASFAAQALAPTSAKVLDRSTLLTGTRTYNAANNNFDFTSTVTNVSGRACKIKASVEKTGSSVLSPITLHMTKKAN